MKKLGRMTAAAVGILTVASVASGCSLLAGADTGAAPKVGQCWQGALRTVQKTENWGGKPAVPCTDEHQLYTYAVAKVTRKFSGGWVTTSGKVDQAVDDAAYRACYAEQVKVLGKVDPAGRILPNYFLPSSAQWQNGARWVRCDVAEIRVGSEIAHPQFADLPSFASIMTDLTSNPKKFALCENDPLSNDPDGAGTTYADCTGQADWALIGELSMKYPLGATYPGITTLNTVGAKQCATLKPQKGHTVFVEPPAESDWNGGNRTLDCWLNNN
jgi:hypothetical protein